MGCGWLNQPGVNVRSSKLFAVLHDSCRLKQGVDDGHMANEGCSWPLNGRGDGLPRPRLPTPRARYYAWLLNGQITIQTCWDADRLDLGRVGTAPNSTAACTAPAATRPDILKWQMGAGIQVVPQWGIRSWSAMTMELLCVADRGHRRCRLCWRQPHRLNLTMAAWPACSTLAIHIFLVPRLPTAVSLARSAAMGKESQVIPNLVNPIAAISPAIPLLAIFSPAACRVPEEIVDSKGKASRPSARHYSSR